ncbi:acyltransferase [Bradyrhizobium sp. WSM3983]|uniref:acyltransferase family protein n=1 Tax=Bradyrhizobium sp. WSM3983 TaxID=1038867 RepID=UPI000411A8B9|nr:acyltransferase [Bradyrhizobium sp. WSM3983]
MSYATLGEKLAANAGRPTGFDYLRLALSIAIVGVHSAITSYGEAAGAMVWQLPARPLVGLLLPMFFALSGFLVAGSLFRTTSLVHFLGLRVIRIYPALAVEVLISALLIGPVLSSFSLRQYFSHPEFYLYLLNATGDIHYLLPGLFHDNPYPNIVNMQLWTVPFELGCYVALSLLAALGIRRHRWMAPLGTAFLMAAYFLVRVFVKKEWAAIALVGGLPGPLLVASFLAGVSLFLYKDQLPWSRSLCIGSGILSMSLVGFIPFGDFVVAPVVAYFTVTLGVTNATKIRLLQGADYSYGVYLYGFVLQQGLAAAFPGAREWWINILCCVPAAVGVAALSWHVIEKPALRLRWAFQPKMRTERDLTGAASSEPSLQVAQRS